MMRFAFISDIHGNLDALKRVFDDISNYTVDRILCLGDIVGYGPEPKECIDFLDQRDIFSVLGNHEEYVTQKVEKSKFNEFARASLEMNINQLSVGRLEKISQFPPSAISKKYKFKMIHSPGIRVENYFFFNKRIENKLFVFPEQSLCFVGHSHKSGIFELNATKRTVKKIDRGPNDFELDTGNKLYVINVGSVGQPRDRDTRASYTIYDSEKLGISMRRIEYEIHSVQKKMEKLGLPSYLVNRLNYGN